jgi:type VI secretion system protein ImpH
LIVDRIRNRDRGLAEFLDIFNHRMLSLFYQAWEKYRFQVAYERAGKDRLSRYLMSVIGLGTPGLQERQDVRDEALLFYSGLLALQSRSAVALHSLLEDYFGVPAQVEQFVGSWQALDLADQSVFEDGDSFSEQLAVGLVAGDAIWDQQSRVRVKLGPLTQKQYLGFLPSGSAEKALRSLIRFFCGPDLEVEIQLVLKQGEVPNCDLGNDSSAGPRLGWFTWMKSGTGFDRAPGDTVLLLM